jgi:SET domain-containing protein
VAVDSGIMTFVNHGCNKSYNSGTESFVDELTADVDVFPDDLSGDSHIQTYNPFVDRHLRYEVEQSIRDIKAGEEILTNYLAFTGEEEHWAGDVQDP